LIDSRVIYLPIEGHGNAVAARTIASPKADAYRTSSWRLRTMNAVSELDQGIAIGRLNDRESSIVGTRLGELGCKLPALIIHSDDDIHGGANSGV
jgi:hypothetical protein